MKRLLMTFLIVLLGLSSFSVFAKKKLQSKEDLQLVCSENEKNAADFKSFLSEYRKVDTTEVNEMIAACKACAVKAQAINESGDCVCDSNKFMANGVCLVCTVTGEVPIKDKEHFVCGADYSKDIFAETTVELSAKNYCEKYDKIFSQDKEGKFLCDQNARDIASTSYKQSIYEEFISAENYSEAKKYCTDNSRKYKERNHKCKEGSSGSGGGGIGGLLGGLDIGSMAGEAVSSEMGQKMLLGAGAGLGIGLAANEYFKSHCDEIKSDKKCSDIAWEKHKDQYFEEVCEGSALMTDTRCKEGMFIHARAKYVESYCETDNSEVANDTDVKKNCKSIDKDKFYTDFCTEEKMENLKSSSCFEMVTDNPKLFWDMYCDPEADVVKSLKSMSIYKENDVETSCAPLNKMFGEEDEDEDDDGDDDGDYDGDDDDDSDDTGRDISSASDIDYSNQTEDQIMQAANQGSFNENPPAGTCASSPFKLGSRCTLRKHPHYKVKRRRGAVKLIGKSTLVCTTNYENIIYSVVLTKNCN